jgi:ubiquinone biosynthesis monooxygenase Coq7
MQERNLTGLDRLIGGVDSALRTVVTPKTRYTRANPAGDIEEGRLSAAEKKHAAGLMRVNHAGEVAAQGLYQGHAALARDAATRRQMQKAADEELDHLGWCEQRLRELGEEPSRLSPFWYAGSFCIGAASGVFGDRWSLGFVEETEKQVSDHLGGHLKTLPDSDRRSRAIVEQMRVEEEEHGANARAAGAAPLPQPVRRLMHLTAKVMKVTAYRF